jgi:hypothetical protein
LIESDSGDETFASPPKEFHRASPQPLSGSSAPRSPQTALPASSLAFIQKPVPFARFLDNDLKPTRLTGSLAHWQDAYVIAVAIVSCVSSKGEARFFMNALPARVIDKLVRPVVP